MRKPEALIRQLCSLGLDSRLMMPRLLSLLHGYIPSFANVYFWVEEDGQVMDIYDENPESYSVLPLYLEEYYNSREKEVWGGLADSAKFRTAVHMDEIWHVDRSTLLKHDFFQDFLLKVGSFWGLHKAIWANNKPVGLLQLKRAEEDKNFSAEDVIRLERISAHIEHAAQRLDDEAELLDDRPVETALLIVDNKGKIHHYTNRAERIMMLSQGQRHENAYSRFSYAKLPPRLMQLLNRIEQIKSGQNSLPASSSIKNQWGQFKFAAYPLTAHGVEDPRGLFVIQIEHLAPLKIVLLNNIDRFNLSSRQTQICLNIGLGKSYSEIAKSIGIKESTLITHKKEIFRKVGVSQRHELADKILTI